MKFGELLHKMKKTNKKHTGSSVSKYN